LDIDKYLTEEDKAECASIDAERKQRADERNEAASKAFAQAVQKVGRDRSKLIVHPMPDMFGGAVIHRLATPAFWKAVERRVTNALISSNKRDDKDAAVWGCITEESLLLHPDVETLKRWELEVPGLAAEVHNTLDARHTNGQNRGK